MPTETIEFPDVRASLAVYCNDEKNLELAAGRLGVRIVSRGGVIKLMGSKEGVARGEGRLSMGGWCGRCEHGVVGEDEKENQNEDGARG